MAHSRRSCEGDCEKVIFNLKCFNGFRKLNMRFLYKFSERYRFDFKNLKLYESATLKLGTANFITSFEQTTSHRHPSSRAIMLCLC
jgi:hypothetical protein